MRADTHEHEEMLLLYSNVAKTSGAEVPSGTEAIFHVMYRKTCPTGFEAALEESKVSTRTVHTAICIRCFYILQSSKKASHFSTPAERKSILILD